MRFRVLKIHAYWKLGLANVLAVLIYRVRLRMGYYAKVLPIAEFGYTDSTVLVAESDTQSDSNTSHKVSYFNAHEFRISGNPHWTTDPFSQLALDKNNLHWSQIPDFDLNTGDVKNLWELSRFEWLIKASWQRAHGTDRSTIPVNSWVLDWCEHNPANAGVNWKCAQECSIRAMNFALSWLIDGHVPNTPDVLRFLQLHADRIKPTIAYAKAQDNNHGTSEAAALFVVGILLGRSDEAHQAAFGRTCEKLGIQLLENRVKNLVGPDGTFSQYSVNYHRMMLDTLSFSECVRRRYDRPEFSKSFYQTAHHAAQWLLDITDPVSGDAPNIGANDGSMLFNCSGYSFRDFRPSSQLGASLFCAKKVFGSQQHPLSVIFNNELNEHLEVQPTTVDSIGEKVFKRVGESETYAILKCPADRFRPSHSDALHVDIWHAGRNLVRDAGTFSYNPPKDFTEDLGSTSHHSTVEIDNRDQMPKLSRFLYGAWLKNKPSLAGPDDCTSRVTGGYRDWYGAAHNRSVSATSGGFEVVDDVEGTMQQATLRWRLASANWTLSANELTSDLASLRWEADKPLQVSLVDSVESRFYFKLDPVVVLELNAAGPVSVTTHIDCH